MQFGPFGHADFLAEAAAAGVRHDLGGSALSGGSWRDRGLGAPFRDDLELGALNLRGSLDLRHEIADHCGTDPERVLPTAGVSVANLVVLLDAIEPGCNVVCERPYYHPLPATAEALGADIRYVDRPFADGWRLDPDAVAEACDPDTAAILVTSPNNPTGAAAGAADLRRLGEVAADHGAVVLADQIFSDLTDHARGAEAHLAVVTTSGFNKTWGAGALRIGWIVAEAERIARCETIHQHAVLAASPVGEHLAIGLLGTRAACRRVLEERIASTHAVYDDWVATEDRVESTAAKVLTAFPRLPVQDTTTFARDALRAGVSVVPGEYFGLAGHVRIGLGGDPDALGAGLAALSACLPEAQNT